MLKLNVILGFSLFGRKRGRREKEREEEERNIFLSISKRIFFVAFIFLFFIDSFFLFFSAKIAILELLSFPDGVRIDDLCLIQSYHKNQISVYINDFEIIGLFLFSLSPLFPLFLFSLSFFSSFLGFVFNSKLS